jgi:DNA-binding NtrC family response regulator
LAGHFLDKLAEKYGKPLKGFKPEAAAYLEAYSWPGNIRELENAVERMVILAEPHLEHIPLELLPQEVRPWTLDKVISQLPKDAAHNMKAMKDIYEKMLLLEALAKHGWNQSTTAKELGTSERNVRYMIKKFRLLRSPERIVEANSASLSKKRK